MLWLVFVETAAGQATDPRTLIDGLRALALEARVELQIGNSNGSPKIFTQAVPDGRTWMEYIADTVGAAAGGDPTLPGVPNQWANLDDAVSLVLAEAESMKVLAAARTGTPDEAKFQTARRKYLAGAARLLNFYKVAAGDTFAGTAGALTNTTELSDWFLPGDIQIKEVGGTARINTESGAFSGRASGSVALAGTGLRLTVPSASFDSAGRFEVDAHGQLLLPPENPTLTVTIPESRPIRVRYSPEDGVSFAGEALFQFANGMFFHGSISLIDPIYSFSITAGGLEFALASALTRQMPAFPSAPNFDEADIEIWNNFFEGLSGSMAPVTESATGADAKGRRKADEMLPPEQFAALDAFGDWAAIQSLLNANPDPAATRGPLTEMLVNLADHAFKNAHELERFEQVAPITDPRAKASKSFVPRVLQIDFGSDALTYLFDGPGHFEDRVNLNHTNWNSLTTDKTSGLVFANGQAADDIEVDLGRWLAPNEPLDMTFQPGVFSNGCTFIQGTEICDGSLGLFDTHLFRDGITTFVADLKSAALAVKVRGFGRGHFLVYGMALDTPLITPVPDYFIEARRYPVGGEDTPFASEIIDGPSAPVEGWVRGRNYGRVGVDLFAGSDELLVLSRSPRGGGNVGKLQGLQIVETLPVIQDFSLTKTTIDSGQNSELRWDVQFATKVTITPNIGEVLANGAQALSPGFTTTFKLVAENSSGVVEQNITLIVDGPNRQATALAQGLAAMAGTYKKVASHLKSVADKNLRGIDEYVDLEKVGAKLDQAKDVYRGLVGNPAALKNLKTFKQVAIAGLDLGASYQATGLDDPVTYNEALSFFESGKTAFETRLGANPQTGQPDLVAVNAKSANESEKAVDTILDLGATAGLMGSANQLNSDLLVAHLNNARAKILATIGFNPVTQQANVAALSEVDTRKLGERLLKLDAIAAADSLPGQVPAPVAIQLGDHLQTRAWAVINRTPSVPWQTRFVSLDNVRFGNRLRTAGNAAAAFETQMRAEALLELQEMSTGARSNTRLTAPERDLLQFVTVYLPATEFRDPFIARLGQALGGIKARVEEVWTPQRLAEGTVLLNELLAIYRLLNALQEQGGSHSIAGNLLPAAQVPVLNANFTAAAQAANNSKEQAKFGRALAQAASALGLPASPDRAKMVAKGAGDPLIAVLRQQANVATRGTAVILSNQVAQFNQSTNDFSPVDLGLPGSLRVTRVFGSILYNRQTGYLQGGFGGRLEFPDLNAFFEVREATIDNLGNFTIDAATGLPLPFGSTRLEAELIAAYTNNMLFVSGSGDLFVPTSTSTQIFSVGLTYDQPNNRFSLTSEAQSLDLRFTDDFVLFDAGFGFDISTVSPNGSFTFEGSAGMFARQHPLPATIGRTNFHLTADAITTVFAYSSNSLSLALSNGTIRLPEFFHNGLCPTNGLPVTGPQLSLVPQNPLGVSIGFGPVPALSFSGALDFHNLGFSVPGLTNLGVEICSGRLIFPSNSLPCFSNVNGTLTIPLPQDTAVLDINGVNWCVNGFPTAANIGLREPLTLLDLNGLTFLFQTNSGFGFSSVETNGEQITTFNLTGDVLGTFDASLLADANTSGAFSFGTSGAFSWTTGEEPAFSLGTLTFGGRLKLGGNNGFELLGVNTNGIPDPGSIASLTIAGLSNIFDLSPSRPLDVRINGALGSADFLFFGLGDARFVFDGAPPEPQFSVSTLGFQEGTQLALLGQSLLPFRITSGSITFLNPTAALNRLFDPTNLLFTFSGVVNISLGDTNDPTTPRLFGAVDNVQVRLPQGFSGAPQFSVNTFALALENLTIGDIAGLSGGLAVGNLNDPPNLFFAGLVGGGFNGVGIKAIVATRLDGLLGLCLSANAGPAGIPLDGGTLGGILLTGAEGGVSFLNAFADPCDFKSFLGLSDTGLPPADSAKSLAKHSGVQVSDLDVLTWAELKDRQRLHEQNKALRKNAVATAFLQTVASSPMDPLLDSTVAKDAGADVPCPTGDCPPATLNLLCQRHPSIGEPPSFENYYAKYATNVIFKFSSLDRKAVDDVLTAANINLSGSPATVAGSFANATTNLINSLIPRPPLSMPLQQRNEINQFISESLAAMRGLVASASQAALEAAAGQGRTPLEALYEAAYAGVKCVDITIQLKGTFSYVPVSVALSGTGGAVASTTGSAGVLGSINLFGVPVGTGEFFYSLTDTNGNPNPSLCGGARMALGPLSLGQMGLAIGCDECVTGTLLALQNFVQGLTGQALTDAQPIFYAFIANALGTNVASVQNIPLNQFFGPPGPGVRLNQGQQIAVLSGLLNLPQVVKFLQQNPGSTSEFGNEAVVALGERTIQLVLNIYNSVNPRLQFCGEVEPKIFGFSLTGGNTLVAARAFADKTNLRADATFSPSYVFGNMPFFLLSGGTVNNVVPALDEATMGFAMGLPLVNETTIRQLTTNPVQFASTQVNHLLGNATLTFGYELAPFGFKLADGEGRVSLPTLDNHPDNPLRRAAQPSRYSPGGQYLPPILPDRATVLKAALDSNRLAQATWSGKGSDLSALFPPGSPEAQGAVGQELVRDYFPYGGFLGAARVQLPKPITDAPPLDQLARLFAPPTNVLEQFSIAQQVFNNYVLGSTEVGALSLYVPFPRPPPIFWNVAQGPEALISSIAQFDESVIVSNLSLYPAEQLFMQGRVNAQLLGLPIGQGTMTADAAAGLFRVEAGTPAGSWMRSFFDAQLAFQIRRADYIAQTSATNSPGTNSALAPETRLQQAFSNLLAAASGTPVQKQQAVNTAVARITDTLPKVSLDVALNNFGIPPVLTNVLRANASARLVAYSPRFDPNFPGTGVLPELRRNGGAAFEGDFNVAGYADVHGAMALILRGTSLPILTGEFDANPLNVPGLPLHSAHFSFHSDPPVGGKYLAATGSVNPIIFGNIWNSRPLLTISNLSTPGARINAGFALNRGSGSTLLPEFSISPSRVDVPMLGPSVSMRIHGNTTNDPFSFSSTGPWAAKASIVGAFVVKDLVGNDVLSLGAVGQQFSANINGTGLNLGQLEIILPTNLTLTAFPGTTNAQTFSLTSGGVTNRILIAGNGTFVLQGGIAGNLPLNGTGFGSISAGASIHIDNNRLQVTINGNLTGGAFDSLAGNATIADVSGTFVARRTGVSLSAVATISPMTFGVFRVSGVNNGNITAVVTNFGFSIPTGAKLRVQAQGYPTNDILTLNAFTISGSGNFNVSAQNGDMNIPGFFMVTTGAFTFIRSNSIASLDIFTPTVRLFPGKPYASTFVPPLQHVFVESTGRFYADSGSQQFNLPGAFVARGRLEFGYEPDVHQPGIAVLGGASGRLPFGTVTYGSTSNRVITVTNTGDAPLNVDITSSQPNVFSVTPSSLNLDANEAASVSVRFNPPPQVGPTNGTLTFFHNAPVGPVSLVVTGAVRAIPILVLSSSTFDLGDGKLNERITRGLRVDNLGLTNLLLTNQVLSGPFTVTPPTVTVLPGSNVLLQVTFTPTAIANFSGTLQIRNNDSGGTRNVPLGGSGSLIRWVDTRNAGELFRSIAMSGSSNILAVTTNRVFYSDTRGHSWSQPSSNVFPGVRAVAMAANSQVGWLCGDGKLALKTLDGGRTWQSIPGLSGNSWRVATDQGGIGRVVFGGTDILSGKSAVAIERAGGTFDLRIVDNSALSFRLSGLTWANLGLQGIVLAQQVNGGILRSTDSGTNWTSITNFAQQSDSPGTIALSSSGVAVAAAYTRITDHNFRATFIGSLYRSANFGSTWTRVMHLTNFMFTGVAVDTNVCYAAGRTMKAPGVPIRGVLFRSGDGGQNWTEEDVEAPPLYTVAARLGETFVAGDEGDIHRRPLVPPSRGVLQFDPGSLNFGFVPFGDSSPRPITFYNSGISNITITNVVLGGTHASQFAIGSSGFPKTIAPGDWDSVNVFCNPTNAGALTASLRINANDPEGLFSVPITARSSSSGWVLKAPLTNSAGFVVNDIQMIDSVTGYALNSRDLYKTVDGGVTWRIVNSPAATLACMHWIDANQGFIGAGSLAIPPSIAGNSFIFRTLNGGTNWTTEYSNTDRPVNNIVVLSGGTGYAVTIENNRIIGDSGEVLKTINNGASWFPVTTPASSFFGRALHVTSAAELFVNSGTRLFRSADGGTNWAAVATNGTSTIRSMDFATASTFGLAVGDDGTFRRTSTGGDTPAEWTAGSTFTTNDLNWVHMVSTIVTWAVPSSTATEAMIFRSDDQGATWREELAESPYAGPTNLRPTVVFGRSTLNGSLALGTDGSVRRYETFTNELEGIAVSQPRLEFGHSVEGVAKFTNFILRNLGDRVLNVSNLLVNGLPGFNDDFRPTNAVPFTIPINGSVIIGIMASNSIVGTNVATLGIVSDGALQSLNLELRNVVTPRPVVISFATEPPGLLLSIDGTNVAAPASYQVRLNANGAGDWDIGSLHTVSAPETQLVNGVTFNFAGWLPFEERTFVHAVTNDSVAYVASYIAVEEAAPPAIADIRKVMKSGAPAGLPTGPYLRLTDASISNAVLGNFEVSGSVLLSAEVIEATLESEAFRLPATTAQPALILVNAGSWRFSLSNSLVRLKAQSPSIRILSNVVNPPSLFTMDLNLSNANFRSSFSLPDGARIAPGLLELGAGSAVLTHTSTFVGLSVTGQVRALRRPNSNNDWAFKQNLSLSFQDGPFTNAIPFSGVLLQIPVPGTSENFVVARGTNIGGIGARLELRRSSSGNFSLFITNLAVDVLGQNISIFAGSANPAGQLSFSAGVPASPFRLGDFRWHATGNSSFDWNLKNGALSFTISGGTLRDNGSGSVPGWPSGGVSIPGFTFDSRGDFEKTITMPSSFTFFDIDLGQASDNDNRYITVKRRDGVLSVKLRDRVDFFDSSMKLGFDLNSNGNASGFFDGSFGADFGGLIGYVHFGDVEASFDSTRAPYEFQKKVRVAGNDFRVKFGSGGAQVCHLYCDDDGCSQTLCLP